MKQNPLISPGYTFQLIVKIELMGPGPLVVNIIDNYCCTRVLFYANMLKETEDEETRLFVTILSFVAFRLRVPCPHPLPPRLRL